MLGWFSLKYLFVLFEKRLSVCIFLVDKKSWKAEAEIDMELFHQVCTRFCIIDACRSAHKDGCILP